MSSSFFVYCGPNRAFKRSMPATTQSARNMTNSKALLPFHLRVHSSYHNAPTHWTRTSSSADDATEAANSAPETDLCPAHTKSQAFVTSTRDKQPPYTVHATYRQIPKHLQTADDSRLAFLFAQLAQAAPLACVHVQSHDLRMILVRVEHGFHTTLHIDTHTASIVGNSGDGDARARMCACMLHTYPQGPTHVDVVQKGLVLYQRAQTQQIQQPLDVLGVRFLDCTGDTCTNIIPVQTQHGTIDKEGRG
jgi:hypothetical protein